MKRRIGRQGPRIEDIKEPWPLHYRKRRSLSKTHPEVAEFWHYGKNCGYGPEDFSYGSSVRVWWLCSNGDDHIFQSPIGSRVRYFLNNGGGCPFCSGRKASVTNNLAVKFPQVAKEWAKELNNLSPEQVTPGSKKHIWWQCQLGHLWRAVVHTRTNGSGCPDCYGKSTDLRDYPKVLKQFDRQRNEGVDLYSLPKDTRVNWKCHKSPDHVWESTFHRASYTEQSVRCPYCLGRKSSRTNNLTMDKRLLAEFHPTKNKPLKPEEVTLGFKKRIWWRCRKKKDHEWQVSVKDRREYSTGCPFCLGRRASKSNNLTLNRQLMSEFHSTKNHPLKPKDVPLGSHKRIWWQCKKGPDHVWRVRVKDRTQYKTGCPFCANKRLSVTNCLANVAPGIANEWHPTRNKPVTPETVIATSMTKYWFRCLKKHVYQKQPLLRVNYGSGCGRCYFNRGSKKKKNS